MRVKVSCSRKTTGAYDGVSNSQLTGLYQYGPLSFAYGFNIYGKYLLRGEGKRILTRLLIKEGGIEQFHHRIIVQLKTHSRG